MAKIREKYYCNFCRSALYEVFPEKDVDLLFKISEIDDKELMDVVSIVMKNTYIATECVCRNGEKILRHIISMLEKITENLEK